MVYFINIVFQLGFENAKIIDVHTQVLSGSQKKVNESEKEVSSETSYEQKADQSSSSKMDFGVENNGANLGGEHSQGSSVSNNAVKTTSTKEQVKTETIQATLRVCVTVTAKLFGPVDGNKTTNKTLIYETTGSYTKTK